jgi:hypothetical protein
MVTMRTLRRLSSFAVLLALLSGVLAASPPKARASGAWSTTGGMTVARAYHTATLLPNGKVLVAGGHGDIGYYGDGSLASTELFDPATGTWTPAAPMHTPREQHAATLLTSGPLAGRVLVSGGLSEGYPAGQYRKDYLASLEVYDPATNSWSEAGSLSAPRYGHAAVMLTTGPLAGNVLVAGGNTTADQYILTSERYDPATMMTTALAPLHDGQDKTTAVSLPDGRVFLMEGGGGTTGAEVYDPGVNTWTPTQPLARLSQLNAPVLLPSGKVFVAGCCIALADVYDPATNGWAHLALPPVYDVEPEQSVVLPLGAVLVVGRGTARRYDPARNTWSPVLSLPTTHYRGTFTVTRLANGKVLVAGGLGGYQSPAIASADLYDDTPYTLALSSEPGGTASASPAPGPYTGDTTFILTATSQDGYLFTGWTVDGLLSSYANPLSLTITTASRSVVAGFAPRPTFADVPTGGTEAEAVAQLAARGIIKGYGDGRFGPICRAVGWDAESWPNPFRDRNGVDDDLWRNIGTLNHYGVAHGYDGTTYGTTDEVLNVQVIAFVARAMVAKGYWQQYPNVDLYPNVPSSSGHRGDLATFVHYAGAVPDFPDTSAPFAGYDQASTRGWFARALWQALNSYFGARQVP